MSRLPRYAGDRQHATAAERSEQAPMQVAEIPRRCPSPAGDGKQARQQEQANGMEGRLSHLGFPDGGREAER
jgi:hypothetical protein